MTRDFERRLEKLETAEKQLSPMGLTPMEREQRFAHLLRRWNLRQLAPDVQANVDRIVASAHA